MNWLQIFGVIGWLWFLAIAAIVTYGSSFVTASPQQGGRGLYPWQRPLCGFGAGAFAAILAGLFLPMPSPWLATENPHAGELAITLALLPAAFAGTVFGLRQKAYPPAG